MPAGGDGRSPGTAVGLAFTMGDLEQDPLDGVRAALAGEYEILRLLGRGGMASVYLARERSLDRLVALKVLAPDLAARPAFRARFEREAAMAAQLQHPNIVPNYRVGELDHVVFFTMGYVEGETLADRMRHRGRLDLSEALRIVREVASALGAAHRRGIIHRDIKPHNILIDHETERVLVTDFGIARAAEPETDPGGGDPTGAITEAGLVMGTPRYMSPEQACGTRDLTPASDLYALGVLAYEMVSGHYPYRIATPPNFQMAHLTQQPIALVAYIGDFPKPIETVIQRLLRKEPERRYQTADALVDDIDTPVSMDHRRAKPPPTRMVRRALAVVVALAVTTGAAVLLSRPSATGEDPRRSVLVGFFENTTGDPSLDWLRVGGVEQLAQSLGRWQDLNIIHVERLLDLARRARLDESAPLSREDAIALAREASVGTATIGSIIRLGAKLRLSVRVYDVRSRELISTASVEAQGDTALPAAFEALADQVLDVSGAAPSRLTSIKPPTRSIAAYRAYIEGVGARSRWDLVGARRAFEQSVRADPRFALAYYELSQVALQTDFFSGDDRFIATADSALRYAADRPPRELLLVEAYHAFVHANLPLARSRYERLIASDSGIADAWIGLGDAAQLDLTLRADANGRQVLAASFGTALRAYERALALDQNDHRIYANLANILGYVFLDGGIRLPIFTEDAPGDIRSVFSRTPVDAVQILYLGDTLVTILADSVATRYSPQVIAASRSAARQRARGIVERWLRIAPEEGTAHLVMARLRQSARDYDGALVALAEAVRLGAQSSVPLEVVHLMILLDARRFSEAAALADQMEDLTDEAAVPEILRSGLVNAYLATGQVAKATAVRGHVLGSLSTRTQTPTLVRLTSLFGPVLDLQVAAALDQVDRSRLEQLERQIEEAVAEAPDEERRELEDIVARAVIQGYAMLGDTARVRTWRMRTRRGDVIHGLDALTALRAGDTTLARNRYRIANQDTTGSVTDEMALAETAAGLGLRGPALAHLERIDSIRVGTVSAPDPGWIRVVRSWPMRATLLAAEGDVTAARQWYDRFLEAWEKPDSSLLPDRDRIRREVGSLVRTDRTDVPRQ